MPKRKRTPQRRGDAMVAQVLRITLEQLAEVGFELLSMPQVASIAGVNKTSLYRRFGSKGALVREALESAFGEPADFVETGDLRVDMLAWAAGALQFAASPIGQAVFRVLLSAQVPELRPVVGDLKKATRGPRDLLERAQRRGEIRAGANLDVVLSTIAGALLHRLFIEGAASSEALLTEVVDVVLDGIRPADIGSRSPRRPVAEPPRSAKKRGR